MNLVIGYVRYSSHAQDDGNSIAAQISTIEKYAADHNMEVEEFFIDTAKTGRNTNRPKYQEMKRKIESGELASKTIIVRALDRLHRNAQNQLNDLGWFNNHQIRLIAVNDGTDTKSSDFSKLALTVKAAVAEEFSDTLAKNTKAALNEVAKQCRHTGGLPPIGYRVNEIGLYEIDETTAPIVRLIYKLYLQDMGYDYISKELKKQGYKTAEGNDFSKTSIHSILTNEKYMGTYTYDKTASKDSSGKRNSNAHKQNYIRIQNGMPAIISSADFEKVKKKLAENAGRQGSRTTKHYYALNGVMKCPKCEHGFTGNINNSNGRKYPQYRQSCKCGVKSVNMDKMNNFTFHALQQCVFSPDNKDKIIERINAKIGRDMVVQSDEINALKNKINKLQDAQNRLMDYLQSGIAPDSILERIQKNENELKQLRNQLDIKSKEIALVDDEAYTRLVKKFKSYMGSVKSPEAKALRDATIEKIIPDTEQVAIYFKKGVTVDAETKAYFNINQEEAV